MEGSGLLVTATDWQMRVELRQRMEFPPEIAVTNKRPDILCSNMVGVNKAGNSIGTDSATGRQT